MNGAGTLFEGTCPGRCPVVEQHYFGCLQKTARTWWSKKLNLAEMEFYFLSRPFVVIIHLNVGGLSLYYF